MMTIFRDDIGVLWGALFGVLIFLRVFAWLAADRVSYIDVNPNMPRSSYVRVRGRGQRWRESVLMSRQLLSLLIVFTLADAALLYYCVSETLQKGPSQLLTFGFEVRLERLLHQG